MAETVPVWTASYGGSRSIVRWEDERYIRVYTRDTVEWDMLCWQARCVLPLIFRKVDRAGLLELGKHGERGLATNLRLPVVVIEAAMHGDPKQETSPIGLLEDGAIELRGTTLVIPNFIEAQEAPSSDAQRKRESRERARDIARAVDLGLVPVTSQNVTDGHENGQNVTLGHKSSLCADPCRAVPSVPPEPDPEESIRIVEQPPLVLVPVDAAPTPTAQPLPALPGKPSAACKQVVDRRRSAAEQILSSLNAARKRVRPASRGITPSYDSLGHIADRLEAGKSAEDCLHVIAVCESECRANEGAFRWFDAVSPFRPENFERKVAADLVSASDGAARKSLDRGQVPMARGLDYSTKNGGSKP